MLGVFILMNALGDLFIDEFGMDFVWISFPGWLSIPGRFVLLAAAATLVYAAVRPIADRRWYVAAQVALGIVAVTSFANGLGFYVLLARGVVASSLPLPSSFIVTALVGANIDRIRRERARASRVGLPPDIKWNVALHAGCALAVAVLGPLAFMVLFGATDYCPRNGSRTRAADCVVVYGARVYADRTPSLSLTDRVRHGIGLWESGAAPAIIMSGGPNERGYAEAQAMLRIARASGVPEHAVIVDVHGHNTHLTVGNAADLMRVRGWERSVSVSHYFHLLRIKLAARRFGMNTITSPCPMTKRLAREPYFLIRECAALYWYYFTKW
jgi:vancomycin permeability regulator SanA